MSLCCQDVDLICPVSQCCPSWISRTPPLEMFSSEWFLHPLPWKWEFCSSLPSANANGSPPARKQLQACWKRFYLVLGIVLCLLSSSDKLQDYWEAPKVLGRLIVMTQLGTGSADSRSDKFSDNQLSSLPLLSTLPWQRCRQTLHPEPHFWMLNLKLFQGSFRREKEEAAKPWDIHVVRLPSLAFLRWGRNQSCGSFISKEFLLYNRFGFA